jgi:hypothetical protein
MTVRLGPDITYTALPYQLPAAEQATLRSLARNCHVYRALHGADSEEYRTATTSAGRGDFADAQPHRSRSDPA